MERIKGRLKKLEEEHGEDLEERPWTYIEVYPGERNSQLVYLVIRNKKGYIFETEAQVNEYFEEIGWVYNITYFYRNGYLYDIDKEIEERELNL